jgi:hypothetical protein
MSHATHPAARAARAVALFLLGAALFAAAYGQAPLYYSNQNQYFLHGLADAGCGLLRDDWLAKTADPTPVFSALVAFTARYLHPWAFHVYHALLQGVYAAAMVGLFAVVAGEPTAARRWPVFVALLVAVHAAVPRWCSYRWFGQDYPWFLQAGVAGQYVLGAMFQPSVFGVLLVAAVCLFARGRPFLAAACAALGATVHATYLLPAGLLTLGFLASLLAEGQIRRALALGALSLALVLPAAAHVLTAFGPTSPATFAEAQEILINVRIPHHTRPDLWLDPVAALQLAWIVAALVLTWRTRFFAVLAVPSVLMALLTVAQVATGSRTLALLFPWRVSSVLVPVATTVILSRLVAIRFLPLDGRLARVASAFAVIGLVVGGVWITAGGLAFHTNDEEVDLMNFVRDSREPGDLYFLPVRVPDLVKSTRGSLSSDFKPLPDKKSDARVIPVDLQRFRLHTGVPIFVDFKSVPYKDTDVREWYARILQAEAIQKEIQAGRIDEALAELRLHHRDITHLVVPAAQKLEGAGLVQVYEDEHYRVYRLEREQGRRRSRPSAGLPAPRPTVC